MFIPETDIKLDLIFIVKILSSIGIILTVSIFILLILKKHVPIINKKVSNPQLVYLKTKQNIVYDNVHIFLSKIAVLTAAAAFITALILCFLCIFKMEKNLLDSVEFQQKLLSNDLAVIFLFALLLNILTYKKTNCKTSGFSWTDSKLKDHNFPLEEIEMAAFYNRTGYMLSTYCNLYRNDSIVLIDIENELIPVRKNNTEVEKYLSNLDNYIFIVDYNDMILPDKNEISDEILKSVENEYRILSPLAMLTVGVINVPDGITEKSMKNKLCKRN